MNSDRVVAEISQLKITLQRELEGQPKDMPAETCRQAIHLCDEMIAEAHRHRLDNSPTSSLSAFNRYMVDCLAGSTDFLNRIAAHVARIEYLCAAAGKRH